MTTPERVVVVGASIGGLTAAETLRQEGFAGEILLIGDEEHLPYNRPPLSKQILARDWEPGDAAIRTARELDELGIRVLTGRAATGLDVEGRVLETDAGPLAFDELIIATGTEPRRHPALPDAATLRTMDDALALRDRMDAAGSVAVVGSGILGSEIASAARKRGADTLLVGRSGALGFGGVGTLLTQPLVGLHTEHGVELALRADVVEAAPSGVGGYILTFADGTTRSFDLVVAMIGGRPRTDWLSGSGLDVTDGIVCEATGSAAPGVWAVGDVAAWQDPATGRHTRVEHQSYAIEQAIAVATRLAHGASSPRPVPLFWSELHGTRITAYGWFDQSAALDEQILDRGAVYLAHDASGTVRGAVGWNATPRDFRAARAAVAAPSPLVTTS